MHGARSGHEVHGMPQQHSWTQYTPIPITPEGPTPRVAAYVSKACTHIRVTQRSDIVSHRDILILEVSLSPQLSFLIINIYNDSSSTALDVLLSLPLPNLPSILSGDLNLHHGLWSLENKPPPVSTRSEDFLNWTDDNQYRLINRKGEVTFFRSSATSVLDLTWVNHRALSLGLFREWQIREDLATGSDHLPITWDLHFSPDDNCFTPMTTPFNFDDDKSLDWTDAYCRYLDERRPEQSEGTEVESSRQEFDYLVKDVMGAMEHASTTCLRRTKFHPKRPPGSQRRC